MFQIFFRIPEQRVDLVPRFRPTGLINVEALLWIARYAANGEEQKDLSERRYRAAAAHGLKRARRFLVLRIAQDVVFKKVLKSTVADDAHGIPTQENNSFRLENCCCVNLIAMVGDYFAEDTVTQVEVIRFREQLVERILHRCEPRVFYRHSVHSTAGSRPVRN
jgi:hypothetical protein